MGHHRRNNSPPHWRLTVTWFNYAEKRYDRVRAGMDNLLRVLAHFRSEGAVTNGWMIERDKIIA